MKQERSRIIEQEIAELSHAIEQKRTILERENKIVEEKELVRSAVREMIPFQPPIAIPSKPQEPPSVEPSQKIATHYLDNLDEESHGKVQSLISETFDKGIKKTVPKLQYEEPFIIDAYHDALVDKLYLELKNRGIIK